MEIRNRLLVIMLLMSGTVHAGWNFSNYSDGYAGKARANAAKGKNRDSPPVETPIVQGLPGERAVTNYTLLDAEQYRQTVRHARSQVQNMLSALRPMRQQDADIQIAIMAQTLADIPYIYHGGVGEGDWQPSSAVYKPGAAHIVQDPVYRFDGFDCQSYVETLMALLYARSLDDFDRKIVSISYGAAGNPGGEIVRFYNRNHFVDGDFNPVNQRNGLLTDITARGALAPYAEYTSATITRQRWFDFQRGNPREHVRVLSDKSGSAMAGRFASVYSALNFPRFDSERVSIAYIPKTRLALKQEDGGYLPDQELLDKIPTPAIVEVVRDVKVWGRGRARDIIGSELNVSHFGVLYRQTFKQGELIYQKISCDYSWAYRKRCEVTPVICEHRQCRELMLTHATDAYPMGYSWYPNKDGSFSCTASPPAHGRMYSQCNRVERLPFYDYVADFQFGAYWYLNEPSILGYHFERLVNI